MSERRVHWYAVLLSVLLAAARCQAGGRADAAPHRVVSLAPSLTELVYALGFGDRMVGRSSACDFPPEAKALPVVGGFGRPNLEAVQGLRPDLLIATSLEKRGIIRRMNELGVETLLLPCESWTELLQAARALGKALGEAAAAERWVQDMTARREALARQVNAFYAGRARPRVYVEVWSDPLTTPGAGTFLDDLVRLAGGTNVAGSLRRPYAQVSAEWVIRQNPQAILLAYMMPAAGAAQHLRERPGWGGIDAVQNGALCTNIPPDWLLRPGPRLIGGAEIFARWLMERSNAESPGRSPKP